MTLRAAYDGCYVREELGDHVMTLIMERIKNGQVEHYKKDIKCPFLPALDAPSPGDCAAIQRSDRLQCANSSVPQDVCRQLGCCFSYGDQPQCYYGNKVTAQCTDDGQVLIILSKDLTVPSLILESAYVIGVDSSSCSALTISRTSEFLMFKFPLSCGGIIRDSDNSVAYENTVQATRDIRTWQGSSITRDSTMRLTVRCRYYQSGYVPLQAEVLTLPPPLPVSTSGPLELEMRIAKDETYASYYTANEYPVTKVLRDLVYLEVRILQRTDPSLILMLADCWATTTPDSTQQLQWPVLVNGCPFPEDNYKTIQVPVGSPSQSVPFPTHYQRFLVSTFTFLDPNDQHSLSELVFFHCSAAVCVPSPTDSCSTLCGQRKKRDVEDSGKKITVSQGPVSLIKPSDWAPEYWDYDYQNDTADSEFIDAENTDRMDGGLIDINNFPRRVKDDVQWNLVIRVAPHTSNPSYEPRCE
ncbi:zona pellucida sperm-binding protein 4-like [Leptodactylus fuscus]